MAHHVALRTISLPSFLLRADWQSDMRADPDTLDTADSTTQIVPRGLRMATGHLMDEDRRVIPRLIGLVPAHPSDPRDQKLIEQPVLNLASVGPGVTIGHSTVSTKHQHVPAEILDGELRLVEEARLEASSDERLPTLTAPELV